MAVKACQRGLRLTGTVEVLPPAVIPGRRPLPKSGRIGRIQCLIVPMRRGQRHFAIRRSVARWCSRIVE